MLAASTRDLRAVALSDDEYELIVERLGRVPNDLELGIFGALWSEHCGYKTSKPLLRNLPSEGEAVLQGPGENAGAVDIGDGLAVVFKIESHNHPSAIEPYQGAATGVGGILRDVFTMGARPIAILDALRFGPPSERRNRYLMNGVVAGIGGYGNCFGCPTVGGEIYFDAGYSDNPIVNAMCVGLVRHEQLRRARADSVGDVLLLVGAATGRDGIHGATFASVEMDESSITRRPAVQVGNPFLEKLLCEACLELNQLPDVVAIQDLGAAGLTSAACELAHRGGRGVEIDVARVSRREAGMNPYEVMLSESQERMLVLVRPGGESAARAVFERFELHADRIGVVIDDAAVRVCNGDALEAEIPLALLIDEVPVRRPRAEAPPRISVSRTPGEVDDPSRVLLELIGGPNLRSRRAVFRTYDHQVLNNTVFGPGTDAALLRIPKTRRAIALTTDGNPWYVALDPYAGTQAAVAEAARNIACTGARPLAVTNCLNFGNPDRPNVMWQLQESVRALADACRGLHLPVVSGNVSLYNETSGRNIPPTPVIGMVGLLEDLDARCPAGFQKAGDVIALLGESRDEIDGSEYQRWSGQEAAGPPPRVDLKAEQRLQQVLLEGAAEGILRSAHDLSDGGLLVALAETALFGGQGVRCPSLDGPLSRLTPAERFFGESTGRVIVSIAPQFVPNLERLAGIHQIPVQMLGVVGGEEFQVGREIRIPMERLRRAWESPW